MYLYTPLGGLALTVQTFTHQHSEFYKAHCVVRASPIVGATYSNIFYREASWPNMLSGVYEAVKLKAERNLANELQ